MKIRTLVCAALLLITGKAHSAFELFSEHPFAPEVGEANDQIEDLVLYNGTIYAGYGTHSNHTFTTRICGFTPPSNQFVCPFSFDSEGAGHFRDIDNKLYIAGIDPRPPQQHFYARLSGSQWFAQPAFTDNVAHIYDIESSGGNIWVTLTKFGDDARLMKGTDNGQWTEVLDVRPVGGDSPFTYSVLFFVAEYQGKLYTQALDVPSAIQPYSFVSSDNGQTWTQGPSIMLYASGPNAAGGVQNYRHKVFAGKLVMKQNSYLTSFDGTTAATLRSEIRNFTVRDGFLYVLEESGRIIRTEDLTSWEFVDSAPENSSSLEVLDNDLYVGTEDAKIYWSENILDELPRITLVPIIDLILNDETTPIPEPE